MSLGATIQADTLQAALDPVDTLVDECKIHLDAGGLSIRAVDPANVAMVDLSLDKAAFEAYQADGRLIGVNLNRLTDVVGLADSGQLVHLELDEETRKLHISLGGLEYTLALIDPGSIRQEPDVPDLDLPATIVIEGRDIGRTVTAADMVADHVTFAAGGDRDGVFHAMATGDTPFIADVDRDGWILAERTHTTGEDHLPPWPFSQFQVITGATITPMGLDVPTFVENQQDADREVSVEMTTTEREHSGDTRIQWESKSVDAATRANVGTALTVHWGGRFVRLVAYQSGYVAIWEPDLPPATVGRFVHEEVVPVAVPLDEDETTEQQEVTA